MTNEITTLAANLALALSFIVALIFGIAQVRAAARDRRERLTLETLRNFQTREFVELMQYVDTHGLPSSESELRRLPLNEQVMVVQFSQEMESLRILVAERLIDIDLVDKTLGSFVSTSWEKYKPMTLNLRETRSDPSFSEYFQWLAEHLDARVRETPRQPYHETHPSR